MVSIFLASMARSSNNSGAGKTAQGQTFFQKHTLKVGDQTTNAANLTLRETIFPLFLVTILYFLWVRYLGCTPQVDVK
jgi:FHS family L-fucose permease-like MFS transporter